MRRPGRIVRYIRGDGVFRLQLHGTFRADPGMRGLTSMPASPNDPAASSLGNSRPPDKSAGLRRTKKADFEKSAFFA
uniref:Uncharacterized protein n=1 Tax=Siphoviridae sp. ctBLh2 TaxID=2827803 RepID=A0A8S5S4F1_9CAUD|nr:MAG TPA: hypothetical protein [Siphoviridae sp. ctBLh2]